MTMRFVIDNGVVTQIPDFFKGPLFPMIEGPVDQAMDSAGDAIGDHISAWLSEKASALLNFLNANSPDIITFGIIICAAGLMVAPLIGNNTGKWIGRMFTITWLGVIWRLLVS
jgi:hypothetical protein